MLTNTFPLGEVRLIFLPREVKTKSRDHIFGTLSLTSPDSQSRLGSLCLAHSSLGKLITGYCKCFFPCLPSLLSPWAPRHKNHIIYFSAPSTTGKQKPLINICWQNDWMQWLNRAVSSFQHCLELSLEKAYEFFQPLELWRCSCMQSYQPKRLSLGCPCLIQDLYSELFHPTLPSASWLISYFLASKAPHRPNTLYCFSSWSLSFLLDYDPNTSLGLLLWLFETGFLEGSMFLSATGP